MLSYKLLLANLYENREKYLEIIKKSGYKQKDFWYFEHLLKLSDEEKKKIKDLKFVPNDQSFNSIEHTSIFTTGSKLESFDYAMNLLSMFHLHKKNWDVIGESNSYFPLTKKNHDEMTLFIDILSEIISNITKNEYDEDYYDNVYIQNEISSKKHFIFHLGFYSLNFLFYFVYYNNIRQYNETPFFDYDLNAIYQYALEKKDFTKYLDEINGYMNDYSQDLESFIDLILNPETNLSFYSNPASLNSDFNFLKYYEAQIPQVKIDERMKYALLFLFEDLLKDWKYDNVPLMLQDMVPEEDFKVLKVDVVLYKIEEQLEKIKSSIEQVNESKLQFETIMESDEKNDIPKIKITDENKTNIARILEASKKSKMILSEYDIQFSNIFNKYSHRQFKNKLKNNPKPNENFMEFIFEILNYLHDDQLSEVNTFIYKLKRNKN